MISGFEKGVLGFAFLVEIYGLKRTSSCRVTFVLLIDTAGSTVSSGYNPIQLVMTTPDDDLSADQRRALELVLAGSNVLVTGPGGTGKTFLIRRIVQRLLEKGKQPAVTALTGAAAALMTDIGARTLHSWGGILARDDVPAPGRTASTGTDLPTGGSSGSESGDPTGDGETCVATILFGDGICPGI